MAALTAVSEGETDRNRVTVYSWGANSYGQLSNGGNEDQHVPREVTLPPDAEHICHITGGGGHTLLITDSGDLFSCGSNNRGQLGQGHMEDVPTLTQVSLPEGSKVRRAVGGWDFTLILTENGLLYGCGSNSFGQLGLSVKGPVTSPTHIDSVNEPLLDVAAGLRHSIALTASGRLLTWGSGRKGQLGWTDSTGKPCGHTSTPSRVTFSPEFGRPVTVSAGSMHSLALTDKSQAVVWGCNKHGQCTVDPSSTLTVSSPRRVEAFMSADTKISVVRSGWTHAACLTDYGSVLTWGRGDYGQLGRPCSADSSPVPDEIPHLSQVSQVACGSEHNLAVADSKLFSWGWGEHGMCGLGGEDNVDSPKVIGSLTGGEVTLIGCGAGHSFAVVRR